MSENLFAEERLRIISDELHALQESLVSSQLCVGRSGLW